MVYGFISSLDDETTKAFFRSKRIPTNNIYSTGGLGTLAEDALGYEQGIGDINIVINFVIILSFGFIGVEHFFEFTQFRILCFRLFYERKVIF